MSVENKCVFLDKFWIMTVSEAFGDVADVLAQLSPEKIIGLKASTKMSERVELLTNYKKEGIITLEQTQELERFLALNMFINLAKARARVLLVQ